LEKYKKLQKYNAINGDIIISRAGTVGKMCVVKNNYNKSIISTNLIRLRLNKDLLPLYFVSLMVYCKGRVGRLRTGPDGSFTHMNTTILDKLSFPYPQIELQTQFYQYAQKTEALKSKYQSSLLELENLYGSLTQRAFSGKLDLSGIPVELSGKAEIATKQDTTPPELEIKPKTKKKEVDKEQKQLAKKLKQIIKKTFQTSFTFNELWDAFTDQYPIDTDAIESESEAQKAEFKQYETIKSIVFNWLDAKKPFLFQVFDEKRKEMVLKPAI
jgi:type I restriction enzyme S subunit